MNEGNKHDMGKLRMDLIPAEMIEALATILTFGAEKYDDNNWMKGLYFRRIYGAMMRHLLAYRRGEYIDPESGHPHLWHAFCNLGFLIYYNANNNYERYENLCDFKEEWAQNSALDKGLDTEPSVPESETPPEVVYKGCHNCRYVKLTFDYPPCKECWGRNGEPYNANVPSNWEAKNE